MIAVPAVIVVALVLALTAGGSSEPESAATPPATAAVERADRFDSARAWKHVRHQLALGPRPAGSPQLAKLAGYLRERLPRGHYEAVAGHPGLRNVVGRLRGSRPAVVVAAHYDTKAIDGFVGANDGAGGTAAVLELARALRRTKRPAGAPELRFVLFDGEEAENDKADFYLSGLRGSKAYARRHRGELRAVVLLDFVADRELRIPREAGSDARLWARLRRAAKHVGAGSAFPSATVGEILDDHTPFARDGVPAIDLIDFDFDCWHQRCDDMSAVSAGSLDRSGEAVLQLLRTWR
jgi:glutaminyl-peptide cyclotransferase